MISGPGNAIGSYGSTMMGRSWGSVLGGGPWWCSKGCPRVCYRGCPKGVQRVISED